MKVIKTVTDLIKKAERKGEAVLNGRMAHWGGHKGELEEKYYVSIDGDIMTMRHWGTTTIELNTATGEILFFYGESNSDRDSLNTVLYYYGIGGRFSYRPSVHEFNYIPS